MLLRDALKSFSNCFGYHFPSNKGYVITPHSVRRCMRVSQEEKLVLFEIYSFYNDEKGYAFPTQETLAMCVGISSTSVSKHLKSLEEKGFITSKGRKGKRKSYYPDFALHYNIYITMSEYFHFAVKILRNHLRDLAGAGWGDHLLNYVNVPKKCEWTKNDPYGSLLWELHHCDPTNSKAKMKVAQKLFQDLQQYVEKYTGEKLDIDWSSAFSDYFSAERNIKHQKAQDEYEEKQTLKEFEKAENLIQIVQSTPYDEADMYLGGWAE